MKNVVVVIGMALGLLTVSFGQTAGDTGAIRTSELSVAWVNQALATGQLGLSSQIKLLPVGSETPFGELRLVELPDSLLRNVASESIEVPGEFFGH